jgi:CRP-like cAMP-binding protein
MDARHPYSHPLVRKIESIFTLTDEEKLALTSLPVHRQELRGGQDIVREHDQPSRSCLVLEGFTSTFKVTPEGKRQILAFHVPGDMPDLQSLHLKTLDNSIGTVSPCTVAFIQHEALRDLCKRHPRISDALWRGTLIDAAIYREWMVNVGRRDAYTRLCHLLCEMVVKLGAVGLAEGRTCQLPMTQTDLGDATGLSTVHVNRTLQDIRKAGLVTFTRGTLKVLDWEGLKTAGEFDPTYLHLQNGQAAGLSPQARRSS